MKHGSPKLRPICGGAVMRAARETDGIKAVLPVVDEGWNLPPAWDAIPPQEGVVVAPDGTGRHQADQGEHHQQAHAGNDDPAKLRRMSLKRNRF